jgi:CheY-like chemotaxis protein/anti-sigma regulatory factor (Ser/Thr protein kinase)
MIYFKAKEKNLSFVTEVDEKLPDRLYGDVVRVRQVITNILNNAVKYTDEGSVSLKISGTREDVAQDGKPVMNLIIAVTDTGIGISQENIGKLFGKFERVDLEKNSTKEGTGLGLAITKMLLDMMGGDVKVDSTYGVGSTFTITIPQVVLSEEPVGNFAEKFEKSLGEKKAYHESFRAPSAKILIVDDTKMNLVVATAFLKETQVQIDTASGGKESVEMALKNKYDVILMDQRMPEMDGEEALHAIKSEKDGPNIGTPVICLTADAVVGARERYLSKGFDDYLTKPIDSTYLERMLKKYIPEEKIEIVPSDEGKAPAADTGSSEVTSESPLKALLDVGVDTGKGKANCGGDEDFYRTILSEYLKVSDEKKKDLNRFFEEGDLKNYGILIHSLKSTSAMIGADTPSKLAQKLESAAGNDDMDYVKTNHSAFLLEYDAVVEALAKVVAVEKSSDDNGSDEDEILEFLPEEEM